MPSNRLSPRSWVGAPWKIPDPPLLVHMDFYASGYLLCVIYFIYALFVVLKCMQLVRPICSLFSCYPISILGLQLSYPFAPNNDAYIHLIALNSDGYSGNLAACNVIEVWFMSSSRTEFHLFPCCCCILGQQTLVELHAM